MLPTNLATTPFTSNGYVHRERGFTIEKLKRIKQKVFVLTDLEDFRDLYLVSKSDGQLRSLDGLSDQEISDSAFYVFFKTDEDAIAPVSRIIRCGGAFVPPLVFSKTTYARVARHAQSSLAESEKLIGYLFGGNELHENICHAVELTKDLTGDFLEIGVFSGSSAATAMTHMRNIGLKRKCWLIDTFEGFNYSESQSSPDIIWGGTHNMSEGPQREKLQQLFADSGQDFELVTANICRDQLPTEISRLALVNLDVDLYEATASALAKIAPLVQHRGVIICEDPSSTPGLYGALVAMNEFMESELGKKFVKVFMRSQYFLIRVSE